MLQHILVIVMVIAFIGFLTTIGIRNAINKEDSKGKSPINKYLFLISKSAYFTPWVMIIIEAIKPGTFNFYHSEYLAWIGILLWVAGYSLMWISYIQLGKNTRFGLPEGDSKLVTSGIYKNCRHPMYAGLYLMIIGITLFIPHWIVITCCVVTVIIHHLIMLAEEKFMAEIFGEGWKIYTKNSRRYLLW